ncbi:hypothetical protein LZC95_24845 [Pendulispora brunnea]|uniref:Outer membrane protein beta-barrel domain-containing protein n=1 Tax=Pendulispora brunnea TaxID=2905690 RepID=A0ABZ2KR21_9BACT
MKRRHILGALFGSVFSLTMFTKSAHAVEPWLDRPLTLPSLHASADVGLGFGQHVDIAESAAARETKHSWGSGASMEAAVGVPILGEVGVRTALRFGDGGKSEPAADRFGRLFDKQTFNGRATGHDTFANPEIFLRGTLVDVNIVAVGLETRFSLPAADDTKFGWAPGIPVRVRIPNLARLDTGIYVPFVFDDKTIYSFDIPAHLWFQSDQLFFGPLVGFRFNHFPVGNDQSENEGTLRIGGGVGYTVLSFIDLKAQAYFDRVNKIPEGSNLGNMLGFGLGAGINVP